MNWRDLLQARLLEMRPESVCALDAAAHRLAAEVLPGIPLREPDAPAGPRCALALGIDALKGLDAPQARHLISRTGLYLAPRILLAAPADCALDEDAFRALGFTLAGADPAAHVRIHAYDIDTSKPVPDWLNPRFWAHPDRWKP
ncbi:MAG TPA: DUF6231 family protein [Thiobacillaceae bacterium]